MSWGKESPTTKHNCGGPVFGKKTPGCPRCDELIAGAKPVQWHTEAEKERNAQRDRETRRHFQSGGDHELGRCGVVCTFGEW